MTNILDTLKKLQGEATKGPWTCRAMGGPTPILIGDHGMRPIVLGASRKNMNGACLTVRNFEIDIMEVIRADHPDIALIVEMRNNLEALLAVVDKAKAVVDFHKGPEEIGVHNAVAYARTVIALRDSLAGLVEGKSVSSAAGEGT